MEKRGSGPRQVLLLHGWISARRMWYDVAQRLDPQRFTLHLLDFRGCGSSDRPALGHNLDGYVSDGRAALAFIEGRAMVVGHSMGGKVAQYLAADRPQNLEKLILVAPGTAHGGRGSERQREIALDTFGSRRRIEAFQRAGMGVSVSDEAMLRIVEDALIAQREHWIGWYDGGRFADFRERLAQIAVPTLCIGGAKDPLVPPSRIKREVMQAIPGALSVTLRNAGHNLPVEAPDEIAEAIARFS